MENQKITMPAYKVMDLIPPIRKHTFAPEVEPSELVDDEAEFQALCGIDWSSPNFQAAEEDEEPERMIQELQPVKAKKVDPLDSSKYVIL